MENNPLLEWYLSPTPTPPGMTSREIVRRAIEFDHPPRVPYSFVDPLESDFTELSGLQPFFAPDAANAPARDVGDVYEDEWGVGLRVTGRTWDQAERHPLEDLTKLAGYRFPDVAAPERYAWAAPFSQMANQAGKYVVGYDPIMMYEKMRALLGFEGLMMAPYTQPEGLEALLDRLTDLTIAVMEQWARIGGVHGFMTWDDFGLQTTLQMKVETFRRFYKPRYARLVQAAHERGMHFIWHNCGQIWELIPELIDIGVDVLQLDQPRLMGSRRLAEAFGGRICFWNTVDIQWCQGSGVTAADLRAEAAEVLAPFARFHGGIMARQYPSPADIGLTSEQHLAIYEAFMENGCKL